MNQDEKIDFGGKLPPEVADGQYLATCHVKMGDPPKMSANGKFELAFLEFTLEKAEDSENAQYEAMKVSKLFMPRSPKNEDGTSNAKGFRMFIQEVQELAAAFKVDAPSISASEVHKLAAWRSFLEELDGQKVTIFTEAKEDKGGTMRVNVHFKNRKNKSLNLSARDE